MPDVDDYLAGRTDLTRRVVRNWTKLKQIVKEHSPGGILEIGTFKGATTLRFCKWAPDAVVTTVDKNGENQDIALTLLHMFRCDDRVTFHRSDSISWLAKQIRFGPKWDFILLDSYHTYAHVMAEFAFSLQLINPPGIIMLDDIDRLAPEAEKSKDRGVPGAAKVLRKVYGDHWHEDKNLGWVTF